MNQKQKRKILIAITDEGLRAPFNDAFQITIDDQCYEASTNGHLLIAFRCDISKFPELTGKNAESVASFLSVKPTVSASMSDLWDFLRVYDCSKCPFCKGDGKRRFYSSYEDYGAADEFDRARYVKIGGCEINANLLAKALMMLPVVDEVKISIGELLENDTARPLVLFGDEWSVVLQLTRSGEAEASFDQLTTL